MPPSKLAGIHLYRLTSRREPSSCLPTVENNKSQMTSSWAWQLSAFPFFGLWIYADIVPLLKMPFLALFFKHLKVKVKLLSCPTFCDPVDCNRPGSSIHGIFQARILEWVAIFFSRGSSWHQDWTQVSRIAGKLFTLWATGEHLLIVKYSMTTLVV